MEIRDSIESGGSKYLQDILDLFIRPTQTLSNCGLTIGTDSAAKIKLGAICQYEINGVFGSAIAANTEVAFTATTHDIPASASSVQEACYLLTTNAAGSVTITMGAISSGAGTALVPATPAGRCPIGYLRLAVAAGATNFDATSDNLSATHLTDTYYSIGGVWAEKFGSAI